MDRIIGGNFNGTGADLYLCLGFVPDWIRLWNTEGTQRILLEWNQNMARAAEVAEGIIITAADQTAAALTAGNGVQAFYGGYALTSTQAGTTTYGEGVYLKREKKDYRFADSKAPDGIGDAVAVNIDTWTLDTSANRTGHFNEDVTGGFIGEGSKILIDGRWYIIQAVTAAQGEGDDEVTLNYAAPSGEVQFITGMYDYVPIKEGERCMDGVLIQNTTLNVNNQIIAFEAGMYSN